jgi:hypothetical protein
MSKFRVWTSEEIEEMKIAFIQGEKVKGIARKLGRTPTALNKALSRFGVRTPRKNKVIQREAPVDWRRYLLPKGMKCEQPILLPEENSYQSIVSKKRVEKDFLKNRKRLKATDSIWVSFSRIINYLERQGHRITPIDSELGQFELDRKPVEKGYMLLLANRLRVEEAKPIFLVNEITW